MYYTSKHLYNLFRTYIHKYTCSDSYTRIHTRTYTYVHTHAFCSFSCFIFLRNFKYIISLHNHRIYNNEQLCYISSKSKKSVTSVVNIIITSNGWLNYYISGIFISDIITLIITLLEYVSLVITMFTFIKMNEYTWTPINRMEMEQYICYWQ